MGCRGRLWLSIDEVWKTRSIRELGKSSGTSTNAASATRRETSSSERIARPTTSFALAAIMAPDRQPPLVTVRSGTFELVTEVTLGEKVTHHVGHRVAIAEFTEGPRPGQLAQTVPFTRLKTILPLAVSPIVDMVAPATSGSAISDLSCQELLGARGARRRFLPHPRRSLATG
jgi:hypothetical protein